MEYIAENGICHETYPEQRFRPDNRCPRLQIALGIFSVSTVNVEPRRIRRFDERVVIYRSKSTSPRSACLVRKSFTESVRPFCRDQAPPSVHISQNPNLSRNLQPPGLKSSDTHLYMYMPVRSDRYLENTKNVPKSTISATC